MFTYTPGLWLFILASIIIAVLILVSWQYRKSEIGKSFLFLMGCAFLWVFFFSLETAVFTLYWKIFFAYIEFLGIVFLPAAWIFLIVDFTGHPYAKTFKSVFLIPPILTTLILWTNPLHHWFMGQPGIFTQGVPFPVLFMDYKFWFYAVHAPTGYLFILISLGMMIRYLIHAAPIYKVQARILIFAILLPSITDVLYVIGISPVKNYNYTTAVFSVYGILLLLTHFQLRFLDLLPQARDRIIENLQESILVLDHKNRVVYQNQAAVKLFHLTGEMIGQSIEIIDSEVFQSIQEMIKTHQMRLDISIGNKSYFALHISPVHSRHGLQIGKIITAHDITERVERFNLVHTLSIQDSLTGILNRRHFITVCNRDLDRIKKNHLVSAAVVMVDLDAFKQVNDTYGHAAGDKMLIVFTTTIQSILRRYDYFGRLGGDEFAIFLMDVSFTTARDIIERVKNSISDLKTTLDGRTISLTASFGIVHTQQVTPSDLDIEILLNYADQALYQGKESGRNYIQMFQNK
jgi:diguanylate cyclase (GGDEF)-like protein/PAS domain S-box-containing protein